jgi:threonyl-tRNA synthetase
MNDAHIYCTREQFGDEFRAVNDMYLKYFKIFGIDKYVMRFSTHDPAKLGQKYIDDPVLWKETEDMVRNVLIESNIPFVEVPDEAAFYGPKIDVQIWSAIGREFTLATNQVDFAQGKRFDLKFTTPSNDTAQPLIIHRAPLGTHERFIGFLIEHYAGNFPTWLAPVQATLLPISDKHMDYTKKILQEFKKSEIRCTIDDRSEKIGKKIRDAELKKIPYMLIIGDKEQETLSLSIRKKGSGDAGTVPYTEVINLIKSENDAVFNS